MSNKSKKQDIHISSVYSDNENLVDLLENQHGLTLLETDINDILHAVKQDRNKTNTDMKEKEKYFIDLSKCSEEQIENIYNTVKETEFIKPNFYTDKDFMMLKFCTIEERWGCSGKNWDGLKHKTELTYPEFIKLFEGGEGENNTYSFSYLSCGKTLTVHIEAKNFNKAIIEFATNYHDIEWLYHAKIL